MNTQKGKMPRIRKKESQRERIRKVKMAYDETRSKDIDVEKVESGRNGGTRVDFENA